MRLIMILLTVLTLGLSGCGKRGDLAAPPGHPDPEPEPEEGLLLDTERDVNRA